jgi:hypothetical protein
MFGDVVHAAIMRQAQRELGEGFAVYSRNSNEPLESPADPKEPLVTVRFGVVFSATM